MSCGEWAEWCRESSHLWMSPARFAGPICSEADHSCSECGWAKLLSHSIDIPDRINYMPCRTCTANASQQSIRITLITSFRNCCGHGQGAWKACDCRHADVGEHDQESNTDAGSSLDAEFRIPIRTHLVEQPYMYGYTYLYMYVLFVEPFCGCEGW